MSLMPDNDEKRHFIRMAVHTNIRFKRQELPHEFTGDVINISASGVLFICDQPLEHYELLDVEIPTASNKLPPLVGTVRIVRVETNGDRFEIGAEFTEIT